MSADPIHGCVERWHAVLRGELPGGLDAVLHEDCTFVSPIVFTPQRGREVTKMYLLAAGSALAGADPGDPDGWIGSESPFRYVKQVLDGHHAVLEFETTIDVDGEAKYANGVDIITCDDEGMIVELKVMIRPLQAIDAVHARMRALLDQLA